MAAESANDPEFMEEGNFKVPKSPSYWKNSMRRFRKNKLAHFALRLILFLVIVALFADFLANNRPIYAKHKGKVYFPVLYDYLHSLGLYTWDADLINARWGELDLESSFWPPIRYKPGDLDQRNYKSVSPFGQQRIENWKFWHFLGTDRDGRDVLSGLIHGTRISLSIGLVAMGIATLIGVILGAFAGYFGDNRLKMTRIMIIFMILGLILGYFYGFQVRSLALENALQSGIVPLMIQLMLSLFIFLGITFALTQAGRLLNGIPWLNKRLFIWVDIVISRGIEIVESIPTFILIITIAGISGSGSLYLIMAIIGLTSWTGIARFTRGEMLRTRSMEYITAARSLGFSEMRVIFRHALPNSIAPVFITVAFGIAGAILTESTLSFFGVGVPPDMVTWGSLLEEARSDFGAWWLAIFPGFAIFITVTIFNLLGEGLRDALDPRMQD